MFGLTIINTLSLKIIINSIQIQGEKNVDLPNYEFRQGNF